MCCASELLIFLFVVAIVIVYAKARVDVIYAIRLSMHLVFFARLVSYLGINDIVRDPNAVDIGFTKQRVISLRIANLWLEGKNRN